MAGIQAVAWDYEQDRIEVRFDPSRLRAEDIEAAIEDEGFGAEPVAGGRGEPPPAAGPLERLPRFEGEPAFWAQALERAAREGKPLLVDFSASWCAPCQRFREETLRDPAVAALLEGFVLIEVDADTETGLVEAAGVHAVPDILLAAPDGRILERVQAFEEAAAFRPRLERVLRAVHGEPDAGR